MAQSEAEPVADAVRGESLSPARRAPRRSRAATTLAAIRREELQAPHVRIRAAGTVRGLASGCTFKLDGLSARRPERRVPGAARRLPRGRSRATAPASASTARPTASTLVVAPTALPYRPPRLTPRPVMRGPQTATVVGPGRRGDLHRQVCPGEGAVPLGPARQAGREQLLLRAGLADLGRRGLGLHPDPAHRPGGDRRLPRGRPGPADHHRPGLQRRRDAALRPAGQRDPVGLEVELLARAAAATTS